MLASILAKRRDKKVKTTPEKVPSLEHIATPLDQILKSPLKTFSRKKYIPIKRKYLKRKDAKHDTPVEPSPEPIKLKQPTWKEKSVFIPSDKPIKYSSSKEEISPEEVKEELIIFLKANEREKAKASIEEWEDIKRTNIVDIEESEKKKTEDQSQRQILTKKEEMEELRAYHVKSKLPIASLSVNNLEILKRKM
ncbi:hypothetical protein L1987_71261 [Smallanthus sonchifolius]|uniref:Uncharacterized protein n=1 Tax=Smallanthus sonchifolius TaxID=185202 RepID=A0ACB9ATJ6_9ASTR|nr:hypothetical protein L1987_71261 [Smallanthus sonchifolius]